jgi:N-acetylglutamate synthase-like GNAT family acetyltransferase
MLKIGIATTQDLGIVNQIIEASNNDSESRQKFPLFDESSIEKTDTYVNFISRNRKQGAGCFTLRREREIASLDMICVHPESRNQNKYIGEKILRYAIKYTRESMKLKRIELLVQNDNVKAIGLFKKVGFETFDTPNTDKGFSMGMDI